MGWFCGINAWLSNSIVVMAKSTEYDSNGIPTKFERIDGDDAIIGPLFSHEPTATRALDTGEYIVYPCAGNGGGCSEGQSLDCDPMIPHNWNSQYDL